ncbi:nuclease-related domain-containing protein [Gloeobacter kilaueensis]|uniref:NERD domain-containing protein n=1 Tax=Gloeobacter kilaueensis (strain ATCC BAA-2537 / CCAP 1431/1 / ULC 316 / JS1) TaxID=1183438 RepID=U5QGK9_GLOK1|nr:nuclease-related domain-containing protein [Gloeobacter kilaueensis]AGY58008.1 hypothetical protein GKIL_1762 [Gloeobacter kilaueensis JS1]
MPNQAGQNVQKLAIRRRNQALGLGICAFCLVLISLAILVFNSGLLSLAALPLIGSAYFAWRSRQLIRQVARAKKGAQAERQVARLLESLPGGWQLSFGERYPVVGDIDALVIAPDKRAWCIDVKSHRGTVLLRSGQLWRVDFQGNERRFEKDFIASAKTQARLASARKKLRVRPIIVFSAARVQTPRIVERVAILEMSELLNYLHNDHR